MRKIKRFAITMLMGLTACVVAVGLSACNTVKKGEREWTDSTEVVHTHEFGAWITEKAATCEEAGSQYRICNDAECGEKQTQSIAATGHKKVTDAAVSATCTTDGKTAGEHCSVCNKVFKAQEVIPAKGHVETVVATCKRGAYCGVCNTTYTEPLNHKPNIVVVAEQVPTCLVGGWNEYEKCTLCTYNNKVELPALGHDGYRAGQNAGSYISPETRRTSCTEKAYCGVCKVEHGEEPSHDFDLSYTGYKTDSTKKASALPTCTQSAFCGECQSYYGEPLGHEMTWIEARPATCLDAGWDEYQACTRDDCNHNNKVEIPALGHIEVAIPAIEPTCTEVGRTAGTQCERCNWMDETPKVLSALGHDGQRLGQYVASDLIDEQSYLADCTRRAYCGICDTEYGDNVVSGIHMFRTVAAQEPTCSAEGWEEYEICKLCNYSTYEDHRIPMLPHTPRYFPAVEPTCTKQGNEEATICIVCETLTIIPALGHDGCRYGQEKPEHPDTIVGNCTTQGYCGICGEYDVEPEGHIARKDATCTTKAECAICGQEYGEPYGHVYKDEYNFCVMCGEMKPAIVGKKENE